MQAVEHVLVVIAFIHQILKFIATDARQVGLLPHMILGSHIQYNNVWQCIIIKVRQLYPHPKKRDLPGTLFDRLPEAAILLIEVQVVMLIKVIGYVNIVPAILVEIGHTQAQAIATGETQDSRFF